MARSIWFILLPCKITKDAATLTSLLHTVFPLFSFHGSNQFDIRCNQARNAVDSLDVKVCCSCEMES